MQPLFKPLVLIDRPKLSEQSVDSKFHPFRDRWFPLILQLFLQPNLHRTSTLLSNLCPLSSKQVCNNNQRLAPQLLLFYHQFDMPLPRQQQ
jgi:hypothetical protein